MCYCYWYFQETRLGYSFKRSEITITNAFQKILDESNCKPNKIWVDKGIKFYNRLIKSWIEKSEIEMCSIHNKGKSAVAERFIKTWKNKIYTYMTSILKICILIN